MIEPKERPILFSTEMVRAILDGRKTMTRRVVKPQPTKNDYVLWTQREGENKNNGKHRWGRIVNNLLEADNEMFRCPYGQIGELLWVKETVRPGALREDGRVAFDYKASPELKNTPWIQMGEKFEDYFLKWTDQLLDKGFKSNEEGHFVWEVGESPVNWIPSIFMPKEACRLKLRITNIRCERLNDISEEDTIKEGILTDAPPYSKTFWNYLEKIWDGTFTAIQSFQSLWESINGKGSWENNPFVWVIEFEVIK